MLIHLKYQDHKKTDRYIFCLFFCDPDILFLVCRFLIFFDDTSMFFAAFIIVDSSQKQITGVT